MHFIDYLYIGEAITSTRFSSLLNDKVKQLYTIRLSRADFHNGNDRSYIADTMATAAQDPQTQENIKLGLMVGHVDHPDPIFDEQGNIVGYHPAQKQKAFWFRKLWYVKDTKELLADIEPMPTNAGIQLDQEIKAGQPVKFSLRAMGECEVVEGQTRCAIEKIDGGDQVETPALQDAEVIAVKTITDSTNKTSLLNNSHKVCCNNCKEGKTCCNKTTTNPLGDKAQSFCVSGKQSRKTLKLGDAKNMNISELIAKLAAEPDPDKRTLMAEMAAMFMSEEAEPMLEEKKVEALPEEKTPVYDETKLTDAINKGFEAKFKTFDQYLKVLEKVESKDKAQAIKDSIDDTVMRIQIAGEFEGRKLENYSEQELTDAFEVAKTKNSIELAKTSLTDSLTIIDKNKAREIAIGKINSSKATGITVLTDEGHNAVNKRLALFDQAVEKREKQKRNPYERSLVQEYKKINKSFVDALWQHYLDTNGKYFSEFARRPMTDSANLITASDLRNQEGVIAGALLRETFQKLTALQYVDAFAPGASSGNYGRQFKIPVKMFSDPAAGTTRRNLVVRAGEAYAEAESGIRYNKFFTHLRGLAFRLGAELEHQLANGVLSFDAVGELISDISDKLARETDSMILAEMQHTCDQFEAISVTNEAVAANEWTYNGAGSASKDLGGEIGTVTYGTNVCGIAKLLTGYLTLYTGHPRPIVEPRDSLSIDDSNLETFTDDGSFTVSIATLGGVTQVRGYLDSDGNIQSLVPDTTATYAIDNENGTVVFKATATSGAAAGVRPTVSYYYATNYNEFNLTPRANVAPENHYSGTIRLIQQMSGIMASGPRYARPDICLFHTSIAMGAYAIADLFENQRSPQDVALTAGYASGDVVGAQPGIAIMQSNGDMFAGARRAILGRRGMTSYAVSKAMAVNQNPGGIVPSGTTRVLPTPENVWFAHLIDVVGTSTLKDLSTGASKKHPGKTIRFVGELSSTASS